MRVCLSKGKVRGELRWILSWNPGTGRMRRFFKTKTEAETAAAVLAKDGSQSTKWFELSADARNELVSVYLEAKEQNVSIRELWTRYQAGQLKAPIEAKPIGEVIAELLATKRAAGRRAQYLNALGARLRNFANGRESVPVSDFTAADVESWLSVATYTAETRMSMTSRVSTLFGFAVRRSYAAVNPCKTLERVTRDQRTPAILTLEQVRKALAFTRRKEPKCLAWLVLALFGGLRPEEAEQTSKSSIDLVRNTVSINAEASKVRQRRIVHLFPNASKWLKFAMRRSKLPLPHEARRRFIRRLRGALGFARWPADILRHTCASMWLAKTQDAGKVAYELGNSPAVLLRHYRELVHKDVAEAFWRIAP